MTRLGKASSALVAGLPLAAVLAVPVILLDSVEPPTTALQINRIASSERPLIAFRVPSDSLEELTFTSPTDIHVSSREQRFESTVGCAGMIDVSWPTQTGSVYRILVKARTEDPWTYSKIKVNGFGGVFHYVHDTQAEPAQFFQIDESKTSNN